MFTIYERKVCEKATERFFRDEKKARAELAKDVAAAKERGYAVTRESDCNYVESGEWLRFVEMKNAKGRKIAFSLFDGHFED